MGTTTEDRTRIAKKAKLEILDYLSNILLVVTYINVLIFMASVFVILSLSDDAISQDHGYIHGGGYVPNWLQILTLCSFITTAFSFLNLLIVSLVKEKVSYANDDCTNPNA